MDSSEDLNDEQKKQIESYRTSIAMDELKELESGVFLRDLKGKYIIDGDRMIGERIFPDDNIDKMTMLDDSRVIDYREKEFDYGDLIRLVLSVDKKTIQRIYNSYVVRELEEWKLLKEPLDDDMLCSLIESSYSTKSKAKMIKFIDNTNGLDDVFVIKESLRNMEYYISQAFILDHLQGQTADGITTKLYNDEIYLLTRLILFSIKDVYRHPANEWNVKSPAVCGLFFQDESDMRKELEDILVDPDAKKCKDYLQKYCNNVSTSIKKRISIEEKTSDNEGSGKTAKAKKYGNDVDLIHIHTFDELIAVELSKMISHQKTLPKYMKCEVCGRIIKRSSKVKLIEYCNYVRDRDYPCEKYYRFVMEKYDNLRKYIYYQGGNTCILDTDFIAPCKEALHKEKTFDQFKKKIESLHSDVFEHIKNLNAPASSDKEKSH